MAGATRMKLHSLATSVRGVGSAAPSGAPAPRARRLKQLSEMPEGASEVGLAMFSTSSSRRHSKRSGVAPPRLEKKAALSSSVQVSCGCVPLVATWNSVGWFVCTSAGGS